MTASAPIAPVAEKSVVEFRRALSAFPTGVALVTATTPSGAVGMTVNSFSSVSLNPMLVLFCPAKASQTWAALRDQETVVIAILSAGQEALSRSFAQRRDNRFEGFEWTRSPEGHPVPLGAAAWFDVRIAHIEHHHAGDHDLVMCEVTDWGYSARDGSLLFQAGTYGIAAFPGSAPAIAS